ncbi:YTH-domain-containing protein [Hysterangium stoloniferum]|nr:YTH-domain-containing protein [Hysterangium stoloniferum]
MSSPSLPHPISPPPVPPSPPPNASGAGGVRRYHTISTHGRSGRGASRVPISEENGESTVAQEDEYVVPSGEWVAPGVGAVGEKNTSLHRQASLPTKYRGYQSQSRQSGSSTPLRGLNSLSAIQAEHGIDGEAEEEWEAEMRGLREAEEEQAVDASQPQSADRPRSPSFGHTDTPSPPPVSAGMGVRRHQSLTYGAAQSKGAGLKRSGTLAGPKPRRNNTIGLGDTVAGLAGPESPNPPDVEENFVEEGYEDEEYFDQQPAATQQSQGQSFPGSPWNPPTNEWRAPNVIGSPNAGYGNHMQSNSGIDDVQRALSALELSSSGSPRGTPQVMQMGTLPGHGQPPRFGSNNPAGRGANPSGSGQRSTDARLVTDADAQLFASTLYNTSQMPQNIGGQGYLGAFNNASYVPPIGHGAPGQQGGQMVPSQSDDRTSSTGSGIWEQRDRILSSRSSNPNLQYQNQFGQAWNNQNGPPPVPVIPSQYLQQQQQQAPRLGAMSNYGGGHGPPGNNGGQVPNNNNQYSNQNPPATSGTPIDIPSLIATKGYNPTNFEIRPNFARYFVIKSYTEDDVHKSLKYEIWSSTDPGNKRLDKAFKECNGRGPIYLFFSVNASGHFCGMAEMLTAVDYTRSSTVWASDKWKGVFKVRWIFVRDIPNANLRHIRLNNTQERKPVTNSRDTQELLPEAGHEMLRIFFTHPARTSLLQDFAYYELQSIQKVTPPQPSASPSPSQVPQSPPQNFQMPGPNVPIYSTAQHLPAPMPMVQGQYLQNVMRNPSPIPSGGYGLPNSNNNNY